MKPTSEGMPMPGMKDGDLGSHWHNDARRTSATPRPTQPLAERCAAHERYTANRERHDKRGVFFWLHLWQRWPGFELCAVLEADRERLGWERLRGAPWR